MRDDTLEEIKKLLNLELTLYNTLRKMVSRELEAIILDGDMEKLLLILQEKQDVISRLQLLSDAWADALLILGLEELRGTSGFWEKLYALFPEEQSIEFKRILLKTRSAAEDLMNAEKTVQVELEKHVEQLRSRMREMTHGRSAFINYAKMGGGYFDPNP